MSTGMGIDFFGVCVCVSEIKDMCQVFMTHYVQTMILAPGKLSIKN